MSTATDFPAAAPVSVLEAPASGPSGGLDLSSSASVAQGLDLWFQNFRKYEATLVRPSCWFVR